jgi:transcriptional regulator with XRE-family HTH domain
MTHFRDNLHWSRILLDLRKERGLTRPQLAELSGIGYSTIENYENQKIVEPSIYKVESLLEVLGYDLEAVLKNPRGSKWPI